MAGRILIADSTATHRIILKAGLSAAAYDIVQASTGAEALAQAMRHTPDLIVLSHALHDIDGYAVCRRLRARPETRGIPVIMIGADPARGDGIAALKAGADALLGWDPDVTLLRARIRNLMRRYASEREMARDEEHDSALGFAEPPLAGLAAPGQIALIAPDTVVGTRWRRALAPLVRDRILVLPPETALARLGRQPIPDAIVIAGEDAETLRLISDLRCRSETLRSAIVMVQDRPDRDKAVMALDLGVSDLVDTGFDALDMALRLRRELARKTRDDRNRAALKDGLRLAATDPLTGLPNRRHGLSRLGQVAADAQHSGERFGVMVLDLDRFKTVNDTYGHAAGDAVLTEVAGRMQGCLRHGDFLSRIGGEEFLAVIRSCDVAAATRAADRLRRVVCETPIALPGRTATVHITLSVGLVMGGAGAETAATMIDRADQALYAAKSDGRNQVTVSRTAA